MRECCRQSQAEVQKCSKQEQEQNSPNLKPTLFGCVAFFAQLTLPQCGWLCNEPGRARSAFLEICNAFTSSALLPPPPPKYTPRTMTMGNNGVTFRGRSGEGRSSEGGRERDRGKNCIHTSHRKSEEIKMGKEKKVGKLHVNTT